MRTIKFRGWDKRTREMLVHPNFSVAVGSLPYLPVGHVIPVNDIFTAMEDVYEVMQYTGLKDKNGVEIYEGDIVKDCDTSDLIFKVEWDEEKAGYYMPKEFDEEYVFSICQVTLEVLGDIYQNPELLASKE